MIFCLPEVLGFNEVTRDGHSIEGYFRFFWLTIFGNFIEDRNNSLIAAHNTNDCILSIQKNKSHVGLATSYTPFLADGIVQGEITGCDYFVITSVYDKAAEYKENGVLDSLFIADTSSALLIGLALILFIIVIYTSFRLICIHLLKSGRRKQLTIRLAFRVVTGDFLHQFNSFPDVTLPAKWSRSLHFFVLLLHLFSFLIGVHFVNLINTDMVTVKRPHIVQSMEDVLADPSKYAVIQVFDMEYEYFAKSPDPLKKKFSKRLEAVVLGGKMPDQKLNQKVVRDFYRGTLSLVERLLAYRVLLDTVCRAVYSSTMKESQKGHRVGIKSTQLTNDRLMGFFMAETLPEEVKKALNRRVSHFRQAGLGDGLTSRGSEVVSDLFLGPLNDAPVTEVQECLENLVRLDAPVVSTPELVFYENLFILLMIGQLIGGIICLIEHLTKKWTSGILSGCLTRKARVE